MYHQNFTESLHIDVMIYFGCRKYEKVIIRKSYIASQIDIQGARNAKHENFEKVILKLILT